MYDIKESDYSSGKIENDKFIFEAQINQDIEDNNNSRLNVSRKITNLQ